MRAAWTRASSEAPFFYWLYTLLIVLGAGVVLIPNFPLVQIAILSQVLNGMLLPVIMIFMLKLINKHELMGEYTNSRWFNWIAWTTAVIVIALSWCWWCNTIRGALRPARAACLRRGRG